MSKSKAYRLMQLEELIAAKKALVEQDKEAETAAKQPESATRPPSEAPADDSSPEIIMAPEPHLLDAPRYRQNKNLPPRPPELAGWSYGDIVIAAADGHLAAQKFLATRQGPPLPAHFFFGPDSWML